jgi:hypothetical protein
MRAFVTITSLLLFAICCYSIFELKNNDTQEVNSTRKWYLGAVENLDDKVNELCDVLAQHKSANEVQQAFTNARLAYKRIEFVVEYYHPYTAQFINNPVIRGQRTDLQGFQELESLLFPVFQPSNSQTAYSEALKIRSVVDRLQDESKKITPTDAQLFDAMRLELVRIMSAGLSGFDSPIANNSLKEAAASLDGVNEVWQFYVPTVNIYNPSLVKYMDELLRESKAHLLAANYETLDKDQFINKYVNNMAVNLKLAREALRIPYDNQQHILDPAASHVFAKNAILPLYSSPDSTQDTIAYNINGQKLTAAYLQALLKQNGALGNYASK